MCVCVTLSVSISVNDRMLNHVCWQVLKQRTQRAIVELVRDKITEERIKQGQQQKESSSSSSSSDDDSSSSSSESDNENEN